METTINNPGEFRVHRHKQGQSNDEPKERLPLRKGIMDTALRAKVSQEVNDRLINDLSLLRDETPARNIINEITSPQKHNGRRFRGLDPTGKDLDFLELLSNPELRVSGLTNKMLRPGLADTSFGAGLSEKQLSAKTSRHLRLLRAHGIIRKLLKQNRYQLTPKGVKLTNLINAFLSASTEQLMKMAA